jgi:hypothetical protein
VIGIVPSAGQCLRTSDIPRENLVLGKGQVGTRDISRGTNDMTQSIEATIYLTQAGGSWNLAASDRVQPAG